MYSNVSSTFIVGEELIGLDTVKKGTPLYGQPDWWGDEKQKGNKGTVAFLIFFFALPFNA